MCVDIHETALRSNIFASFYQTKFNNFKISSSSGKSLLKIMALLIAVTVGSIVLHFSGYTRSAALVAGGPLFLVGLFFGVFIGIIAIAGLSGKPIRWN